ASIRKGEWATTSKAHQTYNPNEQVVSGVYGYFFFQAEDGIRTGHVTGVQTCALPISGRQLGAAQELIPRRHDLLFFIRMRETRDSLVRLHVASSIHSAASQTTIRRAGSVASRLAPNQPV